MVERKARNAAGNDGAVVKTLDQAGQEKGQGRIIVDEQRTLGR